MQTSAKCKQRKSFHLTHELPFLRTEEVTPRVSTSLMGCHSLEQKKSPQEEPISEQTFQEEKAYVV